MTKHVSAQTYPVTRWQAGNVNKTTDQLAEEVPIALVYNGISHAVMLATPDDLEDFALGFSLTEGILQRKSELYDVEIVQLTQGIELKLEVATEQFAKLKEQRRSMAGRTGCGLCGAESLEQVFRLPDSPANINQERIMVASVMKAQANMQKLQGLQKLTGATHACAWANQAGDIAYLREDVGRHNALDKLIGALAKAGVTGGFIMTSSRASYEMVQKVAMAGFDLLAAVSAPTGLAVRIANTHHVTLLGFVRDQQYVAYSHYNKLIE